MDNREAATILAALRFWQEHRENGGKIPECFDYFDECAPLTPAEIDSLCERIRFNTIVILAAERNRGKTLPALYYRTKALAYMVKRMKHEDFITLGEDRVLREVVRMLEEGVPS